MLDKNGLTKKQKEFADAYLETGNGAESARRVYDVTTDGSARSVASETLTKPNVLQYLEDNAKAVSANMVKLALNAESEQVQVAAGKDVLDRAGYKPVEKTINLNLGGTILDPKKLEIANKYEEEIKKTL